MWKAAPWMLTGALLILGTGSATKAQSVPLEQEVTKLNSSVQELVALLREYLSRQEVDLLLKRAELGFQKLGPLEQELARLRAQRLNDEEQLGQLRSALTALQTRETLDEASPDPQVTTDDATRKVQLEAEVKRLRRRISETEQRILEVENELAQEQRNLQQWEAMIDKRLGLR